MSTALSPILIPYLWIIHAPLVVGLLDDLRTRWRVYNTQGAELSATQHRAGGNILQLVAEFGVLLWGIKIFAEGAFTMSNKGKVLVMTPVSTETADGSVVAIYPEDAQPFGKQFLEDIPQAAAGTTTGTTATVSVTLGPDVDTDPADSDSD